MLFESMKTSKGNIGVSYVSQEKADAQAAAMDARNCSDCSDCSNCSNCSGCGSCSDCSNCRNCSYCRNCSDCRSCSVCSSCRGVLRWKGLASECLLALNGLLWPVAISNKQMQIGCQIYSHEDWKGFNNISIAAMEQRALTFWNAHKTWLLSLCEMKSLELG